MKSFLTFINTRFRVIFFFIWMYALIELLQNQRYLTFLRPEFGYVLAAALVMFLALIIAEVSRPSDDRLRWYEFQRPIILMIPLVFLLNAQGASLDYYTFSKRFTGTAGMSVNVEPSAPASPAADKKAGNGPGREPAVSSSLNPSPNDRVVFNRRHGDTPAALPKAGDPSPAQVADDTPTADAGAPEGGMPAGNVPPPEDDEDVATGGREVTVVELYQAPRLYEGKQVTVVGMTDVNDDVSRQFGDRARVVYRFMISCCAADAQPIAMVFETRQAMNVQAQGVWVRVTGRFTLEKKDESTIPVLRDATMSTIPKPKDEYLY